MSDGDLIDLAKDGAEWCTNFADGMFAPAPTRDGWTVEMHGLVDAHATLCAAYLALTDSA